MFKSSIVLIFLAANTVSFAFSEKSETSPSNPTAALERAATSETELASFCKERLESLPGRKNSQAIATACGEAMALPECVSADGSSIFHFDKKAAPGSKRPQRIFAMALIHGDEVPSGSVARSWMERLTLIDPRNDWRVIPIANPDGFKKGVRTNTRGVDLNRNFPSKDWQLLAIDKWKKVNKSDPRRYPGPTAASEPETICYLKHLTEFKPDLVISIHTPLAVLDFDGPQIQFPKTQTQLKWQSIGTFPGSLGRFLWMDKKIPVLTVELTPDGSVNELEKFDQLQDVSGTLAIQAAEKLKVTRKNR